MNARTRKDIRKTLRHTQVRKGLSSLHLGVHVTLMLLLWGMGVYLSQRTYQREDWSRQNLTELSDKTLSILGEIDEPVDMILLVTPGAEGSSLLEDVMVEFEAQQPLLRVEKVDPHRDLARAKQLKDQFEVVEENQIIVEYQERHRVIPLEAMRILESDEVRQLGQERRMIGFQGEAVLSSAILELTRAEKPVVYFLNGHGEMDIDDFERSPKGYSAVRERLEADQLDVRVLPLEERGGVPDDASAVVIAGPRSRISQPELDLLRDYMNRQGRLAVLVDAGEDAGLVSFLREFGVQLSPDVVVDPSRTLQGADVHVTEYSSHPVTKSLNRKGREIRSIFISPRSVLPAAFVDSKDADRPKFSPLAANTAQGWLEVEPQQDPIQYDKDRDFQGPISIAAAVEWSGTLGEKGKRLVVVGDSLFASNWLGNGGGMQLLQNSIAWLVEENTLLEVPPRDVTEIRLQITKKELEALGLKASLILPGLSIVLALVIGWRRRA